MTPAFAVALLDGAPTVVVRGTSGVVPAAELSDEPALRTGSLDALLAAGRQTWARVSEQVRDPGTGIDAELVLPWTVADYVDFYSSEHHARNVGRLFRPDAEPLLPNWKHLPVGYSGRAGTVVVSGTPVVRPVGIRGPGDVGPSQRLDLEAEVGFVVGVPTRLGERVPTSALRDHVFGAVLVNDWSARDVQAFEYVPLGPFLGKAFATSVSSWVVPLDVLPWTDAPEQDPEPVAHLRDDRRIPDLQLEVVVNGEVRSRPPYASTYWTPAQQLAHLTSGGASLRTGDLFASGTVSGPEPHQWGSLLELTGGAAYLQDGDEVVVREPLLGEVSGTVLPAR